jgi:hypothetical protein
MKLNHKTNMILGGVLLILFIFFGYWLLKGKKAINNSNKNEQTVPTQAIIPTVDSSVKVDLISSTGGKEVTLKITNILSGTTSIDYELSYQTAQQGLQGVIGTIPIEGNSTYEKKLTLGTCSSGTCVYHQVVGKIKLTLKFNSENGEKIFEKEYGL